MVVIMVVMKMGVMKMAIEIMGEILASEVENKIYVVNTEGVIVRTITSLKDIIYVLKPRLIGQTILSANDIIYYPDPIET